MQKRRILGAMLLGVAATAGGHDNEVTPRAERERAQVLQAEGPQDTRGVSAIEALGAVSLAGEIPDDSDRVLRTRELTIAPGGIVAVHQHQQRPGVAYILEGEMVEHRNDRDEPVLRQAGDTAFERSGVTHWWENVGDEPVRALVVDIVPAEGEEQ
ncbi:cupin domain-containing protein [Algiphilus aromaticivorans]|uniref:cupin domain-containing protein n=1 Tax=Algiphilus aromaticivorans TaxID=382454 RepID=UPI0018DB4FEA|nr:cupin domain-containing protein [Algiphilus aromaticivorans]